MVYKLNSTVDRVNTIKTIIVNGGGIPHEFLIKVLNKTLQLKDMLESRDAKLEEMIKYKDDWTTLLKQGDIFNSIQHLKPDSHSIRYYLLKNKLVDKSFFDFGITEHTPPGEIFRIQCRKSYFINKCREMSKWYWNRYGEAPRGIRNMNLEMGRKEYSRTEELVAGLKSTSSRVYPIECEEHIVQLFKEEPFEDYYKRQEEYKEDTNLTYKDGSCTLCEKKIKYDNRQKHLRSQKHRANVKKYMSSQ